ncbi:MAG TPA: hypothetical protein VHB93_01830 [Candidatus Paceibacterota bacterium]|nr:hypothetical protein [Candidatus Paceibacterota bacterium]
MTKRNGVLDRNTLCREFFTRDRLEPHAKELAKGDANTKHLVSRTLNSLDGLFADTKNPCKSIENFLDRFPNERRLRQGIPGVGPKGIKMIAGSLRDAGIPYST